MPARERSPRVFPIPEPAALQRASAADEAHSVGWRRRLLVLVFVTLLRIIVLRMAQVVLVVAFKFFRQFGIFLPTLTGFLLALVFIVRVMVIIYSAGCGQCLFAPARLRVFERSPTLEIRGAGCRRGAELSWESPVEKSQLAP